MRPPHPPTDSGLRAGHVGEATGGVVTRNRRGKRREGALGGASKSRAGGNELEVGFTWQDTQLGPQKGPTCGAPCWRERTGRGWAVPARGRQGSPGPAERPPVLQVRGQGGLRGTVLRTSANGGGPHQATLAARRRNQDLGIEPRAPGSGCHLASVRENVSQAISSSSGQRGRAATPGSESALPTRTPWQGPPAFTSQDQSQKKTQFSKCKTADRNKSIF